MPVGSFSTPSDSIALQVHRRQRAAMVDVLEDVGEQRRRALVAHRADGLHDRVARLRRCRWSAPVRASCTPLRCRRSESPAPPRAAPAARCRRAARSGRAARRCRRTRASSESRSAAPPDSASFFSRSIVRRATAPNASRMAVSRCRVRGRVLDRQRLGQRPHQHLAERHAQRLQPLELRFVDRGQVGDDVAHHRAGRPACRSQSSRAWRWFFDPPPPASLTTIVSSSAAASKSPTRSRSSSSDTTGGHQLAPALVVVFDPEQVEDQRQVEACAARWSRSCRATR